MTRDYYKPTARDKWCLIRSKGFPHFFLTHLLLGGLFVGSGFLFIAATANLVYAACHLIQPGTSIAAFMLRIFDTWMGGLSYVLAGFVVGMLAGGVHAFVLWKKYEDIYFDTGLGRPHRLWDVRAALEQIKKIGKQNYIIRQGAFQVGVICMVLCSFIYHAFQFPDVSTALGACLMYFTGGATLSYFDRKLYWKEVDVETKPQNGEFFYKLC